MSYGIGAVTFGGMTGTPYPRLSDGDAAAWAAGAKDYKFKGSPPTAEGEVSAWLECDENDAVATLAEVSGYIGYEALIYYPYGTIGPCTVATVTGAWQAKRGGAFDGVLMLRVTFDFSASKDSTDAQRSLVLCQVSSALAGPWTTEPKWGCLGSADGLGTYAGEAQATAVDELPDRTKVGKWVRLVLKSSPTTIVWVGVIMKALGSGRRDPSTGAGWGTVATYQFAGVAAALATVMATEWYEAREGTSLQGAEPYPASGDGFADVCSPFDLNASGSGNRSSNPVVLAGIGPSVYLPARGLLTSGNKWTAQQALEYFYANCRKIYPTLPLITFANAGLMSYEDAWPISGTRSLLDLIATILGPKNFRTFRVDTQTGETGTPSSASITITALDTDVVAGNEVDLTGVNVSQWASSCDGSAVADSWFLDAGRRTYMATFKFSKTEAADVDYTEGWNSSYTAQWDAATEIERSNQKLANVWRRWTLKQTWAGNNSGSTLPNARTHAGNDETGELEYNPGEPYPNAPVAWIAERTIPTGTGTDWTDVYQQVGASSPVDGPLLWWFKTGKPYDPISNGELQIAIGDNYNSVTLGSDAVNAKEIKTKMDDGYTIFASLSFVHPLSWRVSKVGASPRSDMIRTVYTELPATSQHRIDMQNNCVIGLTAAGAPIMGAAGRKDNGPDLADIRDKFYKWFTTEDNGSTWRIDSVATLAPLCGYAVQQLKVVKSTVPLVTGTIPQYALITRRSISWDRYAPSVSWTVSRIAPTMSNGGKNVMVLANGPQALGRSATVGGDGVISQ